MNNFEKKVLNVPHLRFKEFSGEWEKYKLSNITKRVERKNNNVTNVPLTISSQYGLIDQRQFFNKQIASKDMSNYYLLLNGEFAYNKSYSNGYPVGSIKRLDKYENGAVSTLYICFSLIDKNTYSDFLSHYFDTSKWYSQIFEIANEGARNHGLLNIATKDFFDIKIYKPYINEQQKIADFLTLIDKRIKTQMKIIEEYKSLIKGIREKIFNNANELIELNKIAIFENKTNHLSNSGLEFGKYPFFTNEENTYKYLNSFDFDGEFIIANTGGRANFKYYKGKFAVMTDCLVIKIKNDTYYYFNVLKKLQDRINHIGFEGSGLKHLNKNWLINLKIPKCTNIDNITKIIGLMEKNIQLNIKILNNLIYCKKFMINNLFI